MRRNVRIVMLIVCAALLYLSCNDRKQPARSVNPVLTEEEQNACRDSIEKARQYIKYQSFLQTALRFEGAPYRAGTLEHPDGVERLVVDTSAFDCMTFVESSLALFRCDRSSGKQCDAARYREILTDIRYRNGVLTYYTSRLHYGSEWIADNVSKGYLQDITDSIAVLAGNLLGVKGVSRQLKINVHLMTRYPQRYSALREHPEFTAVMTGIEQDVNKLCLRYIPKDMVVAVNPFLPEGCIVAITSGIDGLDIAHFGIVCKVDGQPHLLHASSKKKHVVVSDKPLYDYIDGVGSFTGIILLKAV